MKQESRNEIQCHVDAFIIKTLTVILSWCLIISPCIVNPAIPDGKYLKSGNETVNIEGYVKGDHYNNPIENAKVVLIRTDNEQRLDSVYTDAAGHYKKQWIISLTGTGLEGIVENKAYPNPCADEVNVSFNALKNDKYQMRTYSLEGKLVSDVSLDLKQGGNLINVKGGASGVQIIRITNGEQKEDYKIIRVQETNTPLSYEVKSVTPQLKSTTEGIDGVMVGQEIKLEFTAPVANYTNYLPGDTTFVVQMSQVVNKKLEQVPYTFTSILKPFLETGEQISVVNPNWTTTIEWPDGETTTHSIVNQQIIQLEKEMYPLNNTLGSIIMHHDTASYNVAGVENGVLDWILIREPHQKTNRPNIAQSETNAGVLIPDYTTSVSLDSLDNKTIHYYTIRKKAETQQGVYEPLNSLGSKGLIGSSGGGFGTGTFIDLKPFGVADSLDIVTFGWNLTTGVPNSPAEQARAESLLQLVINTRYLPNGDTLLPTHRIYTITSLSDPRWQEVVARGYENMIYSTYYSGTPENSRFWSSTYTYNGELRLKNTAARYNNVNNDAQIYEELFSAVTGEEEGSGGMVPFIWNATTWQPSQYAYSISTIPVLLNLGTGQNVKSKGKTPERKELYDTSINGQ